MAKRRKPSRSTPKPKSPEYPLATIAYYGPDDKAPTKVAVGIVERGGGEVVALERWVGAGVWKDPKVAEEIRQFISRHGAKSVVMTDGNIGCPHEEGKDFPVGEDCPFCPFWKGKQ